MGDKSAIEWTNATWNPVTGCDKVSAGCKHCYAEVQAERLQKMGQRNYANGFRLTLQPHMLEVPLRWKRPRLIFVNSMSDLFHESVPVEYILRVWDVMVRCPQHTFQVLTKRATRLPEVARLLPRLGNVWLGVSVENQRTADRVDSLLLVPRTVAPVRFLSCEPLLGQVDLDLTGIDWVIAGGESGPKARPMHPDWARSLRDQCVKAGVPFFFKQWGNWTPRWNGDSLGFFDTLSYQNRDYLVSTNGCIHCTREAAGNNFAFMSRVGKRKAGRELDGRTWDEMPEVVSK